MRLFTYGIFMSYTIRLGVGIYANAKYATVLGYATIGDQIVMAVPDEKYTLTGMIVGVPDGVWPKLDRIEGGYDRITVTTTYGQEAQMYVRKNSKVNNKEKAPSWEKQLQKL